MSDADGARHDRAARPSHRRDRRPMRRSRSSSSRPHARGDRRIGAVRARLDSRERLLRRAPSRPRRHAATSARTPSPRSSGPSGCGKSTLLRCINRMHELVPGRSGRGPDRVSRHRPLRAGRRPGRRPPHDRHGLPAAEPVPDDVDLRQRRRAGTVQRRREGQGRRARARRAVPAPGRPLGRGQGQAPSSRGRRCPAASSSGCASPGPWRSSPTSS